LESIIGQKTKFITIDGRVFVGLLKGLDQALNCIITEAE
jgi:small nuclear ribonucleoprotein (snRNP)-like protein